MIPQYELKAEDIRAYTLKLLKDHVKLKVAGYVCTTDVILDVLLKASAESSSIEAASNDLQGAADSNTIREYLYAVLDIQELREQESEMNAALAKCIPESMPTNATTLSAGGSCTTPLKRRWIVIPPTGDSLQPSHNLFRCLRILPF